MTITKSITIDGTGTFASILASGTNGVVVAAGTNEVVRLRGLSIQGAGTGLSGIRFNTGGALFVEDTAISGFTADGIWFNPGGSAELYVSNTAIRNNGGAGIHTGANAGSVATAILETVRLENNQNGLEALNNSRVTVSNSLATNNTSTGVLARADDVANVVEVNVDATVVSQNSTGVQATSPGQAAVVRLSDTLIVHNGTGIASGGNAVVFSHGDNRIAGNTTNGAPNAPRADVGVGVTPQAPTQTLQTTITARETGCTANNRLLSLRFTRLANATVDVPTTPVTAVTTTPTTVALPSQPASITLTVHRVTAGQAATAELVVTDNCGDWPTFVGGGPSAF